MVDKEVGGCSKMVPKYTIGTQLFVIMLLLVFYFSEPFLTGGQPDDSRILVIEVSFKTNQLFMEPVVQKFFSIFQFLCFLLNGIE